ncbi:NOB1 family endonuclease [Methanoplanus limicola]|uniref:Nucleotide binding protein PINc n=1 Tax=Methanoplanus limicola DSM 2279 TaxID=937775 RepID=H1YZX9_9EURY|nr:NOB1 family endonuclease [Methanoplanus limicola]EHQ35186.1 nucleotide binding protein PINc [Methanoplanus limicola DSM 2279]
MIILDSSFFFTDIPLSEKALIPPSVLSELKDFRSKCRFETLSQCMVSVESPSAESLALARAGAEKTKDITVLSETDLEVIALAIEKKAELATDDFAVSNTAQYLGIEVKPIQQRKPALRKWKYRCSGCGRYAGDSGICDVCGSEIKRKLK